MKARVAVVTLELRSLLAGGLIAGAAAAALALYGGGEALTRSALADAGPSNQTITVAIAAEPLRLDPHDARDGPSALVNFHIYDRLVEVTPEGEVVPGLAESWRLLPDGVTYLFSLRRGVTFHDGTPLDAEAVVANFERLLEEESPLARRDLIAPYVEAVEAVDSHTVAVRLYRPFGPFIRHLAHESLGIISPKSIQEAREGKPFRPAGTGPFMLQEWVPGDRIVLERRPGDGRAAAPAGALVFRAVPDGSGRAIALETGAADVVYPLDPVHVARLRKSPGAAVETVPGQRVVYAAINLSRPPFHDRRVRQALNFAVDADAVSRHLLFGLARRLDAPLAPTTWGHAPVLPYRYAPREAKRLLQDAGAEFTRPLELWSPSSRYLQDREVAEAVAAYLRDAGFDVRIRLFEWGTYLGLLSRRDEWDLAVLGWIPATGDADMALRPLYYSGARGNHSGYSSAALDRLLDEAAFTQDEEKRRRLYQQAQVLIAYDAPAVFLYAMDIAYGRRSDIDGIVVHSTEILDLRRARRRGLP